MKSIIIKLQPNLIREILFLTLALMLCWGIHLFIERTKDKSRIEIAKVQQKLDSMPSHQFIWYGLIEDNLYHKSYKEFRNEYQFTEDQIVLFDLVSNNQLYTRSFSEFRSKYFPAEQALDFFCFLSLQGYPLDDNIYISAGNQFWSNLREQRVAIKDSMKDSRFFKEKYANFVRQGYKNSKEDFYNLIYKPYSDSMSSSEISRIENLISNGYPKYLDNVWVFNLLLFIVVFPFRYLIIRMRKRYMTNVNKSPLA
jgi:hypothetical protein